MPDPAPDRAQPGSPASIQAPWRLGYLEAMDASEKSGGVPRPASGSFLREYWLDASRDQANHVIVRTLSGLILLNAYPYANGHLLVALGDARPTLLDYEPEQRAQLWRLTDLAAEIMHKAIEPQGINIGVNQGRAAGAGVPQHLHVHLVPRWGGDVNFMAVVGQVRVIPGSLDVMWQRYHDTWDAMGRPTA